MSRNPRDRLQATPELYSSKKTLMWDATSTVAALSSMFTDTGTILAAVIGVILAGLIALLGLGFGVRHVRKYITGRKF